MQNLFLDVLALIIGALIIVAMLLLIYFSEWLKVRKFYKKLNKLWSNKNE
jgi:hypothetical protein